eukprot:jgi/Galph1/4865/GphlegSOOS_G3579.1
MLSVSESGNSVHAKEEPSPANRSQQEQPEKPAYKADTKTKKESKKVFTIGNLTLFGFTFTGVGLTAFYYWDPQQFHQYFGKYYDTVESKVKYFTEPSRDKLLPDPISQFPGAVPPRTLVLDLDETLVHSTWSRATGVDAFLAYMSSFYEIVIYTSAMPGYGEPILERLDPNGYISHRLYRDATKYDKGVHIKDLSKLNRDLARTIIIDDDPNCFQLQPDNGIAVPPWTGDVHDRYLLDLISFLEYIVREDVQDVRPVLRSFKGIDIPTEFAKRQQLQKQAKSSESSSPLRAVTSGVASSSSDAAAQQGVEPPAGSIWARLRQKKSTTS